jgi:hypothetical protein
MSALMQLDAKPLTGYADRLKEFDGKPSPRPRRRPEQGPVSSSRGPASGGRAANAKEPFAGGPARDAATRASFFTAGKWAIVMPVAIPLRCLAPDLLAQDLIEEVEVGRLAAGGVGEERVEVLRDAAEREAPEVLEVLEDPRPHDLGGGVVVKRAPEGGDGLRERYDPLAGPAPEPVQVGRFGRARASQGGPSGERIGGLGDLQLRTATQGRARRRVVLAHRPAGGHRRGHRLR